MSQIKKYWRIFLLSLIVGMLFGGYAKYHIFMSVLTANQKQTLDISANTVLLQTYFNRTPPQPCKK